jgi:hypothetical protein
LAPAKIINKLEIKQLLSIDLGDHECVKNRHKINGFQGKRAGEISLSSSFNLLSLEARKDFMFIGS